MTEFDPLRSSASSEYARRLLRSVDRDEPPSGALGRAAGVLGLGGAVATTASIAQAATGVAAKSVGPIVLKALGLGVVAGLVVSLGAQGLTSSPNTAAPRTPPAPTPIVERPARPSSELGEQSAPGAELSPPRSRSSAEPLRPARGKLEFPEPAEGEREPVGTRPMPALSVGALPAIEEQAGRHASGTASIADEIANVDRARLALREGRSQDAWNELELYRARWPEGALAIEVAVLRIETKLALGNRLGARQEARAFLAKQPSGRYAARLRALFEAWELQ